jgi:DNA anti-recombination protein RmuC
LQRDLDELGLGSPEQLDAAREAMESAEQALEGQQYGEAAEQQGRALDEMRQSAQSMAQQMLQQMPSRYGQTGDSPRDPLGRPQRSQGPDLGTSVKVPDQIDMQRAREILEELRRRLGEATRPEIELDYLERLLRRF